MNKLLKTAAVSIAALAISTSVALANPYAPYKGDTLVVNFPAHPHYNAVMKVLPEFTKETGIKVEVDQLHLVTVNFRC